MACLGLPKREGVGVSWGPWRVWSILAEGATIGMVTAPFGNDQYQGRPVCRRSTQRRSFIYREQQGRGGRILVVQRSAAGASMVCIPANRNRVSGFRSCFTGRATGSAPGGLGNGASVRDFGRECRCRDGTLTLLRCNQSDAAQERPS